MLKCQVVESISASLQYPSAHTSAEQCSTKRETIFCLFCCFKGEQLAEALGAHTSLRHMATKNIHCLSLLFLLRDKKEKKIHGLCSITYCCLDWGEENHVDSPSYISKNLTKRMKKQAALNMKNVIQNTYLVSQSADLCLSLSICNSLPCAALLG